MSPAPPWGCMNQGPGHDGSHPWGPRVGMSCCLQECDRFHGLKMTQEKHKPNQQKLQQDPAYLPHLQSVLLFWFFAQKQRICIFLRRGKRTKHRPERDEGPGQKAGSQGGRGCSSGTRDGRELQPWTGTLQGDALPLCLTPRNRGLYPETECMQREALHALAPAGIRDGATWRDFNDTTIKNTVFFCC